MNTWIHTLVINIFYEAIVIKTTWTGTKAEIQINGKNRRQNMISYNYSHLIFDKEVKTSSGEKTMP